MNYPLRDWTIFSRERDAVLARFLNQSEFRPAGTKRVLRLVECCRELQKLRDVVVRTKYQNKKVAHLTEEVNALLQRYHFYWQLPPTAKLPALQASTPPSGYFLGDVSAEGLFGYRDESLAADLVLRLAEKQRLELLQQCLECKEWFMKKRGENQKFCGLACSKRAYRHRNKKAWAAYMKEYRKLKASGVTK